MLTTDPNLTELIVILDASTSMNKVRDEVIEGFNMLIEDQKKLPGECLVTLIQFSTHGQQRTIFANRDINSIEPLTARTYVIRGWTALRDAIGSTIDKVGIRLAGMLPAHRPSKVIFAIMTDGEENDSEKYSPPRVREMVEHQRDAYQWEFVFTAANQDACLAGAKLGMDTALAATYEDSQRGTRQTFSGISLATGMLRSGDRVGACAAVKGIEEKC